MPKSLALIRDLAGHLVPLGGYPIAKRYDFLNGAMPAGLQVSSGTPTYNLPSALSGSFRMGNLQVTTAATIDALARLETVESYHTSHYEAILWEVDGLRYDVAGPNADIVINISGSGSSGAYAIQRSTDAGFRMYSANQFEAVNYNKRDGGEALRRVTLGLLIAPAMNEAVLLEGDQAVHVRDTTGKYNHGVVKPALEIKTKEAAAHSFYVSQCRLTLWQT